MVINSKEELKEINKIPFNDIYQLLDEIDESEKYINELEVEWNELNNLYEDLQSKKKDLENIKQIPFDDIYKLLEEIGKSENIIENLEIEKSNITKPYR